MAGFEASRDAHHAPPPVPEEPSYAVADLCGAWRVETRSHKVRKTEGSERQCLVASRGGGLSLGLRSSRGRACSHRTRS
jgi:hypothetical protein